MQSEWIFSKLSEIRDEQAAIKMSAYMRNKFNFLGVRSVERKGVCKEFYKESKKGGIVDWNFINDCWQNEYREMQYVAIDYLITMKKLLTFSDVDKIKILIQSKSWWDTIDGLDRIIGGIALCYPETNTVILKWSLDEDFWLRRIAIDHQLLRKGKTDTSLLCTIILNNLGQDEFFINKAIGWSLRDYSKTNPEWVRGFIEKHKKDMAPLSIKEASKYL